MKSWKTVETTGRPIGRHETSFVEFKGKFYMIGGREADGRIDCYDPEKAAWSRMKAKTPLIHHYQPVVVHDKIYMAGAMTGHYPDEPPMDRIQIYDPAADKWEEGSLIPEDRRRGSAGTVVYKGKIYLAGGITLGHTSGTNGWFDCYDPSSDTWETLSDAPRIRDHFHAVVIKDKMYCLGGRNTSYHTPQDFGAFFGAVIREVDVYDFTTGSWSTLPRTCNLPVGSAAGGTAVLEDKIIYFGGETDKEALSGCWEFDPAAQTWSGLARLNQGRHGSQAVSYGGKIYIAAGSPVRGGGNLDSLEVLEDEFPA